MDQAAIRLIEALDKDGASIKDLRDTFELGRSWLKEREKASKMQDEGAGVRLLAKMVEEPEEIVKRLWTDDAFKVALERRGVIFPDKMGPGRNKETGRLERRKLEIKGKPQPEHDDSKLRAMLGDSVK